MKFIFIIAILFPTDDGHYTYFPHGIFSSQESCEAALPKLSVVKLGYPAKCEKEEVHE